MREGHLKRRVVDIDVMVGYNGLMLMNENAVMYKDCQR